MSSGYGAGRGKSKITAGILALLLGGFGVHHFYLGSVVSGVIVLAASLLLCGLGGVVALIEGIMLLVMSDADFDAKYNQRTPESLEFVFQKK